METKRLNPNSFGRTVQLWGVFMFFGVLVALILVAVGLLTKNLPLYVSVFITVTVVGGIVVAFTDWVLRE